MADSDIFKITVNMFLDHRLVDQRNLPFPPRIGESVVVMLEGKDVITRVLDVTWEVPNSVYKCIDAVSMIPVIELRQLVTVILEVK